MIYNSSFRYIYSNVSSGVLDNDIMSYVLFTAIILLKHNRNDLIKLENMLNHMGTNSTS